MSEIVSSQLIESEFGCAGTLPKKGWIDVPRNRLRFSHELRQRNMIEPDQHGGFLPLGALAVLVFHLQGGMVVGQHGTRLECAVFFEKNVHVLCNGGRR